MEGLKEILAKINNLLKELKDKSIIKSYTLIGAFAVSIRARPRATKDIDFLVIADKPDYFYQELTSQIEVMGYQSEIKKGDINDPLPMVIRVYDKEENPIADFIISYRNWEKEVVNSSELVYLHTQAIPVPLEEDLVVLKIVAGNAQDIIDAQEILKVTSHTQRGINFDRLFTLAKKAHVLKQVKQILSLTKLMPLSLPHD